MKKIKRRAFSALLVTLALLAGLVVYVYRFSTQSASWVTFSANEAVYHNGRVITGRIIDRSGIVLASSGNGKRVFAADSAIRTACLHAVGDRDGNIGTGALTFFADRLSGYSALTGVDPDGATLTLNLDARLCAAAYDALGGRRGAVLVMDYTSGELLCMVSSPAYDPEKGFDAADPRYDSVYINRCISSIFTPGSVFKLVTLAAAIDTLPDLRQRSFVCTGSVLVDGSEVHCTGVHGTQTIEQALANSCNCAFAELSLELGGDVLAEYAERLGFTAELELNGIPVRSGHFDASEDASAALAWSGIGQSTDLISPYAMLRCAAAIANGGIVQEPSLLAEESCGESRLLKQDTAQQIKEMMSYAVNTTYGTWNFPGLNLCAKSGTAEVGDGTSHAWFTGFLDDAGHPYAFVVLAENAGGGARVAGPIANAVLQAAIDPDQ